MNKNNAVIVAFMVLILGNLFATFVDVVVKMFANNVSIFQYLFLRQIAVLLLMLPFWLRLPKIKQGPGNVRVHIIRGVLTNIGAPAAVIALLYLPLATANVFFYSAPLFTLLLASLLLKEPMQKHRIIVTILGFSGVVIALRPEYFNLAGLLAICTALAIAGYNLSVRWLPKGSSTTNTILWSNIFALPITGIIAAFNWSPISNDLILLATTSCLFLVVYQGCSIIAFQKAEAGAIVVAEYSGLIFAALLGWLIFNESVDLWTFSGIMLITLPIIWQSWYENKTQKLQPKL
ncbi:DMT family transporter [Aliikangiella sp. IMCC44359]|uniref:DMT family transporter n=1 Tax=Aliikangiella sp. IMCC44359 TaxID=3459125 RepID=UPI00403ABB12